MLRHVVWWKLADVSEMFSFRHHLGSALLKRRFISTRLLGALSQMTEIFYDHIISAFKTGI
jgi:hypothetical protein